MLESFFIKVASLKACSSIKNRLQRNCFPVKFAKFLRTPFFKEFQWLLLRFQLMFWREFGAKAGATVSNKYQIQLIKKVFAAAKIQKQPPQVFCWRMPARASNPYNSESMGNNWILIVRETYGKHKHSKAMGYLDISCVTLIHTIPKIWEKWIPRVRKNMGKHKHFKVKCFWNFSLEAENHAVPKTWQK